MSCSLPFACSAMLQGWHLAACGHGKPLLSLQSGNQESVNTPQQGFSANAATLIFLLSSSLSSEQKSAECRAPKGSYV